MVDDAPVAHLVQAPFLRERAEELRRFCAAFDAEGWSAESIASLGASSAGIVVVTRSGTEASESISGILLARAAPGFCELLYIYTDPRFRRVGLGARMLDTLLTHVSEMDDVEAVFLEVRVSNVPAQRLYERYGWKVVGRRKGYYGGKEDALVGRIDVVKRVRSP